VLLKMVDAWLYVRSVESDLNVVLQPVHQRTLPEKVILDNEEIRPTENPALVSSSNSRLIRLSVVSPYSYSPLTKAYGAEGSSEGF
jgi:hypothetical protein